MVSRISLFGLALMASMGVTVASAQTVADELRAAEDRWQTLHSEKNAQELASLYTEDSMRLPPDGSRVVGRDAVMTSFEEEFAAGVIVQLDATDVGHDDDGELGWVVGDQTVEFPVDGEMMTGTGNYVVVYRKEDDGTWRIVVDTWNDAP